MDQDLQARVNEQLHLVERYAWERTVKDALVSVITVREKKRGVADFFDPTFLSENRDPGRPPRLVEDVSWTESTLPSSDGVHEIPVRIYTPTRSNELRPGYILYHGGGLAIGHLNTEHKRCIELTRTCGAVGISVDYRLAPEHPPEVILRDCYDALKHVSDNASEYNIDPRRICITGGSGGGMAALAIAQMARDRKDTAPLIQIALYPGTDYRLLPDFASRNADYPIITRQAVDDVYKCLRIHGDRPYTFPNLTENLAGICPACIIVAEHDPLRDEAIQYAWRLMRAGVSTALYVMPGTPHGFDLIAPQSESTRTAYKLMTDAFLRAAVAIEDSK